MSIFAKFFTFALPAAIALPLHAADTHPDRSAFPVLSLPARSINLMEPVGTEGASLFPVRAPASDSPSSLPGMFSPSQPRFAYTLHPWKTCIKTTVFWVGELPTPNNPTPNTASSWDPQWSASFGGYDNPDPSARNGFLPKAFIPRQNPFYVALPYNDLVGLKTKPSARKYVSWFDGEFYREGKTVLKGRWVAIRRGDKVCYGQWEDCGPFETDDWRYVFQDQKPITSGNGGAGLDVSPAVRDYLGFRFSTTCDWRFVELHEVPDGPWKKWGHNNPFALHHRGNSSATLSDSLEKLHEIRSKFLAGLSNL